LFIRQAVVAFAADGILDAQEVLHVPVFVNRKKMDVQPLDLPFARREFVAPAEMIAGASGQKSHFETHGQGALGLRLEEGFGPADRGAFGKTRGDED
jgi:hypothetical protein